MVAHLDLICISQELDVLRDATWRSKILSNRAKLGTLKTTEKICVLPGSLQLHFSAVYNSEKLLESGIRFVSFMFATYSSFSSPP